MLGIYDANSNLIPFTENLDIPFATRDKAGLWAFQNIFNILPDPDPVLRKMSEEAQILQNILSDDQVTTAILARKNRVLSCGHYGFNVGAKEGKEASETSQKIYAMFLEDLEKLNIYNIINNILDTPFFGFVPFEILYAKKQGYWRIIDIAARPYHWFRFDTQNNPVFVGSYASLQPMPLPTGKFVFAKHSPTYDNPYGLRLLSRCLWAVTFKKGGMEFYAKFVERHGMPWIIGKAPQGSTSEAKKSMAYDLSQMIQDCVAVIPAGAEVETVSIAGTHGQLHEEFLQRQDRAISKILMGQTLTIEMEGRNNSQAAATTHNDVAQGLAEADKVLVTDTFNEIAWLYTRLNFGENTLAPTFSYDEPEDLTKRAELDTKLHALGVRFTTEYIKQKYDLKENEFYLQKQEEVLENNKELSFATKTEKTAAEKANDIMDEATTLLLPLAIQKDKEFMKMLAEGLERAETFEEAEYFLIENLIDKTDGESLDTFLGKALSIFAMYGASAVKEETEVEV